MSRKITKVLISRFPNFLPNVDRSYAPLRRSSTGNGEDAVPQYLHRGEHRGATLERDKSATISGARARERGPLFRVRVVRCTRADHGNFTLHVTWLRPGDRLRDRLLVVRTFRRRRSSVTSFRRTWREHCLFGFFFFPLSIGIDNRSIFENRYRFGLTITYQDIIRSAFKSKALTYVKIHWFSDGSDGWWWRCQSAIE